jgi:hypothetical protein
MIASCVLVLSEAVLDIDGSEKSASVDSTTSTPSLGD